MKLFIVLFAVLGLSAANLKQDLDDFAALIPVDQIKNIYLKYQNDPDIIKVVAYLKSNDFAKVTDIVAHSPDAQDFVNFLESKGVPAIDSLNKLADLLGLPHWPSRVLARPYPLRNRSWQDFVQEVAAVIPVEELTNLAVDKLANSEDFGEMFEKIANCDYQRIHDAALSHPEIVDMLERAKAMGLDVDKIWETIKSLFGWE